MTVIFGFYTIFGSDRIGHAAWVQPLVYTKAQAASTLRKLSNQFKLPRFALLNCKEEKDARLDESAYESLSTFLHYIIFSFSQLKTTEISLVSID